jgi:probable HAF family extracellular repeat protein
MYSAVSMAFVSTIFVAAAAVSYSEYGSLGDTPGFLVSGAALAVNTGGDIVGRSYTPSDGPLGATLWVSGSLNPTPLLNLPDAMSSEAVAISSTGAIAGTSTVAYAFVPTVWASPTATPVALAGLGGMNTSVTGINANGDVAGYGLVLNNEATHAIVWPAGGAAYELPPLSGGALSQAFAINAAGDVVGISDDAAWLTQATLWPASARKTPVALKSIGGTGRSVAFGINDNGDIVGESQTAAGAVHATLWPAAGRASPGLDLGVLLGGNFSGAAGINAAGDIVGYSGVAGDLRHATVWPASAAAGTPAPSSGCNRLSPNSRRSDSKSRDNDSRSDKKKRGKGPPMPLASYFAAARALPVDLGTLAGGSSSEAKGINASGLIVGFGDNGFQTRTMSWKWSSSVVVPPTPTPTPGHGQQGNHQNEGEEEGDC